MIVSPSPAGDLKHRVTILRRISNATSDLGEPIEVDIDAGTVWARVKPLTARDRLQGAELYQDVSHEVRIRYRDDITSADLLDFRGRKLTIESLIDIEEQHVELVLLCSEIQ